MPLNVRALQMVNTCWQKVMLEECTPFALYDPMATAVEDDSVTIVHMSLPVLWYSEEIETCAAVIVFN